MEIAILAGGLAKRIGGVYKPLVNLCGKPLLQIIIERLENVADRIVIVVHTGDQERLVSSLLHGYMKEVRIVRDVFDVFSPLVGLYTAATYVSSSSYIIIPADAPFIKAETLQAIFELLDDSIDAVIPKWPNGYIEPLVAVYRKNAILNALKDKGFYNKPVSWLLELLNTKYVDVNKISVNPPIEFFNLNTYEDLAKAERICREVNLI